MKEYLCIHGHFYQPPRENPWLEDVELQDTAKPYHDWNERITAECYAPNAAARILSDNQLIQKIDNNYREISFNFGPTLLSWFQKKNSELLMKIVQADKESQKEFEGHGAAIAQAYNHMIMPLANTRDKVTQIKWGIADFKFYFAREPEGMWLPETAVDIETLEIMAEQGIKFTILAPHQAKQIRKLNTEEWQDVSNSSINIKMPYLQKLPSGRSIAIFFYDGGTSRAVAFEKLLNKGETFAERLLGLFSKDSTDTQLVHIATDGETYGHHYAHGDMALAYALEYIKTKNKALITIYGQYLEKFPPTYEVAINENTSWSCAHGIERWRSNCGCNGGHAGWNQAWRKPLRESLDWLRDKLAEIFEKNAKKYFKNPWKARDDYIAIILDRSEKSMNVFFKTHATHELKVEEKSHALKYLEMQRHAMLMYTSCGWFFDELSGIETVQVMLYAARALQLTNDLVKENLESEFLQKLEKAPSNISAYHNGKIIYEKFVLPAQVNLMKAAAHFAISTIFSEYKEEAKLYCFQIKQKNVISKEAGKVKFKCGLITIQSIITLENETFIFAVLHQGDQNLNCGIIKNNDENFLMQIQNELSSIFDKGDYFEFIRSLSKIFGDNNYSIRDLFSDEQRKIVETILSLTLSEVDGIYRQIGDNHISMIQFLNDIHIPLPQALNMPVEYVINSNIKKALQEAMPDLDNLNQYLDHAKQTNSRIEKEEIDFLLEKKLAQLMVKYIENASNEELLAYLVNFTNFINDTLFEANLWEAQNILYEAYQVQSIHYQDEKANELFKQLCNNLKIGL